MTVAWRGERRRSESARMDIAGLQAFRERAHFDEWEGYVDPVHVTASRAVLASLVDEVLALGDPLPALRVEAAVARAVESFNALDAESGWIMTIEREAIADALCEVADLAGIDYDPEELLADRDW